VKRLIRDALTHPRVLPLAFPLTRGATPVFMLHRFADPASGGGAGHDPDALRANLAWLRRHRFSLLSLAELFDRLRSGEPVYKSVAFTVDDGFADFAQRGQPVFAEFDCPVTVFLATSFLDGHCWLWWNQVEYLVTATRQGGVMLDHGPDRWEYRWSDRAGRDAAILDITERLKRVPEADKRALIDRLGTALDVPLPATPPPDFTPMSWSEVRRCARAGVTFGPHTRTHPVLSRTGDVQAADEIAGSWRRVRDEAGNAALPVFCYPNGDDDSFGERDIRLVAEAGLTAAVSTNQGYATRRLFLAGRPLARFAVPRMPYIEEGTFFVQMAGGLERAKRALRRAVSPARRR
jgi:peptidoglycan/xylan/chitin deacetylase (PgdA/CDA1 family)